MMTDREVLARLRAASHQWVHQDDCPAAADGGECLCGLDRLREMLWPVEGVSTSKDDVLGWQPGKFTVRHYTRGDLYDGDVFVLLPDRDPVAVTAIVAYAATTPDLELASYLRAWMQRVRGNSAPNASAHVSWIASLSDHVRTGRMTVESALFRLARLLEKST